MLIRLPWPPTVNLFYRSIGRGRVLISTAGREYIQRIAWTVRQQCPGVSVLQGRLDVRIEVTLPDRRKRDLDNMLKPTLDALTKANV